MLFPRTEPMTSTIASMIAQGWNVLVKLESGMIADHPSLWYANTLFNTYANACELGAMVGFDKQKVMAFADFNEQALLKISWALTPDVKCIVNGIRPHYPWGVIPLADSANGGEFNEYIAWLKGKQLLPANILLVDHYQTSSLVQSLELFNCL